ncbi:MAG TPA: zf-HC2 domain-containing protein [Gemmatimonadaceae bacterium]|nr:zf-HC2 domain-containing protein [Gemmatimonadaceae bacterium]
MQHPDEGTIHSWLDGALPPEEATRLEAHVAECPECASAVAEARGFIAASSRILTKLDDVPSGVVPVARPVRRRNFAAWQAAAAVLVVAIGSLVVLRDRGDEKNAVTSQRTAAVETEMSDTATVDKRFNPVQSQAAVVPRNTSAPPAVANTMPAPPRDERGANRPATTGSAAEVAQTNAVAAAPTAPAPPFAADARAEQPLRLVKEERVIGGTRTLYAVTPGDTVTLFEPVASQLQGGVAADAAVPMERSGALPQGVNELSTKVSSVVADSAAVMGRISSAPQRRAAKSAAAAPTPAPAPPPTVQARPVREITWIDRTSGRVLTLSGRLSVDQLEEVKRRIERERATAAAAGRKPPK